MTRTSHHSGSARGAILANGFMVCCAAHRVDAVGKASAKRLARIYWSQQKQIAFVRCVRDIVRSVTFVGNIVCSVKCGELLKISTC